MFNNIYNYIIANPMQTLVLVLLVYFGFKWLKYLFRYFVQLIMAPRLIYMRVTMPREDTTKDKDKQVEKDFKEKIAIMEQFYRNIHEIRELSFTNRLRTFFLNLDLVSFELVAQNKEVHFYVVTYDFYKGLIEKQITSYYPDADIVFTEPYKLNKKNQFRCFYAYLSRDFWFPIKTYKKIENDPLNDLTNVLSKIEDNDQAIFQIIVNPRNERWHKTAEKMATSKFLGKTGKKTFNIPVIGTILNWIFSVFTGILFGYERMKETGANTGAPEGKQYIRMLQTKEEDAKMMGEKAQQVGFDVSFRIIASAPTRVRAYELGNNMILSLNLFKAATLNFFQTKRLFFMDAINNQLMLHSFSKRLYAFRPIPFLKEKTSMLVPEELAGLYHFPNSRYNYTPVIKWLLYKVLPAPMETPQEGLYLGDNVYRGMRKKIYMLREDRTRHHYIIGKSGSGKSAFISFIARQDIANGDGVCVVDPHGDLIEDILKYIPKERAKDVIVFNPADIERPMGLNILEAKTPEQQDLASSQATEIFIKLFGDEIFGPRIQHYFRNACLTLMEDEEEGATLIDVPRIFVDDAFMKYKVKKVKNPVVKSFWEHEYAHTGERERQEMIPYFSAKFGPFITNSIMRNTIGQTKSAFNFREAMDTQKILLINLAKGRIGDLNTQLLGLVIVARIQMAAMSRADMPEDQRKDFYLYVDEFQNFATDSFCSILSEARKYRLGLIMAHQYIKQLEKKNDASIRNAVFGNVGTMMSFKIGADDAEYMAKEYAPVLTEADVLGITNYKAYIKLSIKNSTSRPFSMETIWDTKNKNEKVAGIIKEYSRMKYGRKREFVDQEIAARIGIDLS
ncbi:type IV secretory system conjugative DNA transfer family protein [Candidatus Peregrinibacteria bacterium]|nr:type IV secretory system conjugative DNA transfer family protein [Candidatus Peregrinibacteria bacterium]